MGNRTHRPRAACYDCERPYGDKHGFPDLVIPNDVWRRISPTGGNGGLLCPSCICKRLADAGIQCEGSFMSGPIRSVSPELMSTMRWVENLQEQGHGWACPTCHDYRERGEKEQGETGRAAKHHPRSHGAAGGAVGRDKARGILEEKVMDDRIHQRALGEAKLRVEMAKANAVRVYFGDGVEGVVEADLIAEAIEAYLMDLKRAGAFLIVPATAATPDDEHPSSAS